MIRFRCSACQKKLKAPDNGVGRKTSCPRCGQRLQVPAPSTPDPFQPVRFSHADQAPLVKEDHRLVRPTADSAPFPLENALPAGPFFGTDWLEVSDSPPGGPSAPRREQSPAAVPTPGQVFVACPRCACAMPLQPHDLGQPVECPRCKICFNAAGTPATPLHPPQSHSDPRYEPDASSYRAPLRGARNRSAAPPVWPLVIAVAALLSVVCLWVPAVLFRGPVYGGPATYESYSRAVDAYERLDRTLAPVGLNAAALWTVVFVFSLLVSFGLVITSFCLWDKHAVPGRVLTIAASVLFVPSLCCGVWP
jgi:hypothetical protein